MTWDGISRRKLLSSAAAVGALGAITGIGTAAYLTDTEQFRAFLESGRLDLTVACRGDGVCTPDGDSVRFALGEVTPGDCGSIDLCLDVAGNPAWLWLRADCPTDGAAPIGDYLHADLTYADGTPVTGLPSGSLADLFAALAAGVRIDADHATDGVDPFRPGQPAVCLTLSWAAPAPSPADETSVRYECADAVTLAELQEGRQLEFELEFFAGQHRHSEDESEGATTDPAPTNPWPDAPACEYVPREPCLDCRLLGKHELDDDGRLVAGESYPLLDGNEQPTGYELLVQGVRDNEDGETTALTEFTLIEAGSEADPILGPAVCQVVVGAGPVGTAGDGSNPSGSPNPVDTAVVCPPSAHVVADLDAGDYALSNVSVYVCDPGSLPDCDTPEDFQ